MEVVFRVDRPRPEDVDGLEVDVLLAAARGNETALMKLVASLDKPTSSPIISLDYKGLELGIVSHVGRPVRHLNGAVCLTRRRWRGSLKQVQDSQGFSV